ncbi:MAG: hypothetical protein MPJ24_11625, partial [Pirellulaceae bacterium]|nr:hypothetical protein [Pirellulaceae bacterium]
VWTDSIKNSDDGKEYSGWLVNNLYTGDFDSSAGTTGVRGPRYFIPNRIRAKRTAEDVIGRLQMREHHYKSSYHKLSSRGRAALSSKGKVSIKKEATKVKASSGVGK